MRSYHQKGHHYSLIDSTFNPPSTIRCNGADLADFRYYGIKLAAAKA